jgi:mono/diheme cytochrome c family protein
VEIDQMNPRLAFAAALAASAPVAHAEPADLARGAYLARIMDCGGCHTPRGPDGLPEPNAELAGGAVGFELPGLGVFWPSNLTPDATGLGGWSDAEIADAIRLGLRPDGRALAPVMPWQSYAALTDADVTALIAYLRALPPVARATPAPVADRGQAAAPFFAVALPD